jgi:hypothetical protein
MTEDEIGKAQHVSKGSAYEFLVEKPEGKRSRGRSRRRQEDNIKTYLKEIEWEDVKWIWLKLWTSGGLLSTWL